MIRNNNVANPQQGNFWIGFITGSILLFFFGTKRGRVILKQLIDISENLEGYIRDADYLELPDSKKTIDSDTRKGGNLSDVISRIQHALPSKKSVKKYFAKDGKILKNA